MRPTSLSHQVDSSASITVHISAIRMSYSLKGRNVLVTGGSR